MTVVAFPKRLPAFVVDKLPWWEQGAYRRGTSTVTIETEIAVNAVRDRLRGICELPELQVFGRLNNPLIQHFGFETDLTIEAVRTEAIAIRTALAEIGIPGMAIETQETNSDD